MISFKNISLVIIVLLITASGCTVSQNAARPSNMFPQGYRIGMAPNTDTLRIANKPYQEFFREPMIRELIDTALVRNYDMQIALKNIESAALIFRQSKWGNVPEVNLRIAASSNRPSDNSLNGLTIGQFSDSKHIEDYNASLGLSWEADIWRKIANQQNVAGAAYLQSTEVRKAVQTRLASDIAHGF
ncbi:TolC family protein, partial [Arcticibacter svalbardensis]|uniref:TolC family protein n=1 Tax=Arcticibacter svalbardensis TaxID=1288027 RepID=UPI001360B57D